MIAVQSKINASSERAFNDALKEYMKVTRRSLQEVLNNKAYFIAVNALNTTYKADKGKITAALGKPVTISYASKKGKARSKKTVAYGSSAKTSSGAPLAALIINARKGRGGKPGLYGAKMTQAIRKMINARLRAVNFVRSSWIPAIRQLSTLVKKGGGPRPDTSVKQLGKPKGGASPAVVNGNMVKASIWSAIEKKAPFIRQVLEHGISKALRQEAASMREYVAKKLSEDTRKFHS